MMSSSQARPGAVVIGLDSITGLQTARALAARRIPVTGIAEKQGHPSCRTNACVRIVVAQTSGEALAACLRTLGPSFATPPVLFPCTDLSVLAVSRYRSELARWYRMVLPAPGVTELLLDKASFQVHAAAAGLAVARAEVLSSRADAERAAGRLRFPCVLKPAVKTPSWQAATSAKVYRVENQDELLKRYDECRGWTDRLIVQEWVDGPDSAHVTCNAYFDARSNPHLTFVSQKVRQWPLEGGVGCLSRECQNEEVRRETIKLFQGVAHRGLAYLEMKLDARTNRYVIIEPNVGRPTGRSAAADSTGVELLLAQYCDALDAPLPPAREQRYQGGKWIYFRQDLQSAFKQWRHGRLSTAEWLRSLQGCQRDAVFSWKDPQPFIADLATAWRKARRASTAQARKTTASAPAASVDFDVHGIVGIRLLNPSASDIAAVARQLGPFQRSLRREPDIFIQFVDDLPVKDLIWVEFGRTGFNSDGFYAVQSGKRPAKVRLPLDQLGQRPTIVCQRGLRAVPHLIAMVTLTALERGSVPLHASAFKYHGVGVLVTGWAKGGKTESLLAFAAEGAEYVGDEWILLTPDGRMLGLPEHIRLQDWHLAQLPIVQRQVSATRRLFFGSVRLLDRLHQRIAKSPLARLWPGAIVGDALPALKRQLNTQLNPSDVFQHLGSFSARFDKLFLMVSHDRPEVSVEDADAEAIADRMLASVGYERLPLMSAWLAYQFAFPSRSTDLFERFGQLQRAGLTRLLAGKEAYMVRHPYPCSLRTLFEAMAPVCHPGAPRVTPRPQSANQFVSRPLPEGANQ